MKKALGGIDTKGMANIQSSLSRIATMTGSLDKLSASIDNLASKMKGVSNIKVAPKVDTSGVSTSTNKMGREVEKIEDKMTRLKSIANAAMGGDASAITSFNRKAASLIGDLDVIDEKFKRLGDTRIPTDSFIQIENQMKSLDDKLKLLQEDYRNVASGKVSMSDDQFIRLKSEISSTRTELDGLADKQREMITNGTAFTDPYGSYRESVVSVRSELEATMNKVNGLKSTTDGVRINPEPTVKPLEIIGQKAFEVSKQLAKLGAGTLIHGIKGLGSAFSKLKDSMSDINSRMNKFHGFMDKGFMRILKYGFGIRSLYVGFRRLRKAVVESFGELQKSGAFFQTTKSNIEGLKTSLTTLKFQFGAAFEPIFNAVAPALQTLVDYLVKAMNVFSAFTAKLMGKDTYSRAVASSGAIAGNVGSAAKSAKELNKQLQGFDELNNLTTNDNSGGGGGGGTGGSGSGVTYVTEQVDNVLGDFGKELAKLIKEGDWEGVGAAISEKLTEQLNNIKWENLKAKAANFGKNLGDFINGLITPELFSAIGTTIGESINTVLTGTLSLGETIKWDNVGESIAAGINAFAKTNPLDLIVENFNVWANGILDAVIKALEKTDFKAIAQNIADGIGKIDVSGIAWKVGKVVDGIVDALNDLLSNKETWSNLGTKIADGINGFFKGVDGKDLAKLLNNVTDALFNAITIAVKNIEWKEVGKDIAGFLGNLNVGTVVIAVGAFSVVSGVAGQTLAALASSSIVSNLTTALAANAGTIASVGLKVGGVVLAMAAAATIGYQFGTTLGQFIATWLANKGIISKQGADEYMVNSELSFTQKIADIKLAFKEGTLKKAWDAMMDDLLEPVFQEGEQIIEKTKSIGEKIIEGIKKGVTNGLQTISTWVSTKFNAIVTAVKNFFGIHSPSTVFESIGEDLILGLEKGILNIIDGIKTWLNENVVVKIISSLDFSSFFSKGVELMTNLQSGIEEKTSELQTWFKTNVIDKLSENVVNIKANLATTAEELKSKVAALKKTLTDGLKTDIQTRLKSPKKDNRNKVKDKIKSWKKSISKKITMELDITSKIGNGVKKWIQDHVVNPINKQLGNWASKHKIVYQKIPNIAAEGGVYSNGRWSSIPQYASGGVDALKHGSVIVAGEKGPEVAGHINGRTEILNKSQLASIMYTSITRGMAQFRNAKFASPDSLGFTGTVVNTLANSIAHNNDSALIEEQNRLLAEQNRLLQQIANKDVTISSREVFKATRREAQNYNNMTGNSPFIF